MFIARKNIFRPEIYVGYQKMSYSIKKIFLGSGTARIEIGSLGMETVSRQVAVEAMPAALV